MPDNNKRIVAHPERNVGFPLPEPVTSKLDAMTARVEEVGGGRTSRREMIGMLIFFAENDGAALEQRLREYRTASIADLALEQTSTPSA